MDDGTDGETNVDAELLDTSIGASSSGTLTAPARPAGWYPDPTVESWWDGSAWTRLTRPTGSPVADGPIADPAGVPTPGWYPTPGLERWWDGARWTPTIRSATDSPSRTADRAGRKPPLLLIGLVVLAAVVLGAGAVLVLSGRSSSETSETSVSSDLSGPTASSLDSAPPPSEAAAATTSTSGTTTTSTSTTLPDPAATIDAAVAAWPKVSAAASASAGPELIVGVPVGVVVDAGRPAVWRWNGAEWLVDPPVSSSHAPYPEVLRLEFADVTRDGVPEIVIAFDSRGDAYGDVLLWSPNGYESARFDLSIVGLGVGSAPENLTVRRGDLVSLHPTCQPTCSDTAYLELDIEWTGSRFEAVSLSCADYRDRGFRFPMVRCDRGEFVENLQVALQGFGYLDGGADGYFGPGTEAAVRVLQGDAGWAVTGEVEQYQYIEIIEAYYDSGYDS